MSERKTETVRPSPEPRKANLGTGLTRKVDSALDRLLAACPEDVISRRGRRRPLVARVPEESEGES